METREVWKQVEMEDNVYGEEGIRKDSGGRERRHRYRRRDTEEEERETDGGRQMRDSNRRMIYFSSTIQFLSVS